MSEEARYYESDSPCRRCNGTTRYKNTDLKGRCVNCASDADRDRWARNWVESTRKDEDTDDSWNQESVDE